jgi:hypothetical protein
MTMSIKCSLLGHRFDETGVERDREEDGSEVVITITELETCSRCGETRVVSENKEVTTMETPDAAGDDGGADGTDEDGEDDEFEDYDPDGDDAEILGADDSEDDAQAQARTATIPDAEETSEPAEETADDTDDAVIIDDGPDETDPAPAAEPDVAATATADADAAAAGEADPGEWPEETKPDDEPDEQAEPAMGESDGEWPEEPGTGASESYDDWPDETKRDSVGDAGAAGPTLGEPASPTITVPEGMFKCSECGFTTEVESSSLRAGDFCPDCQQGTLVEADADAEDA